MKLGFDVSERTVSRLVRRAPKPPSQTWRTFLENHVTTLASIDFFVTYTITFELLYASSERQMLIWRGTGLPNPAPATASRSRSSGPGR